MWSLKIYPKIYSFSGSLASFSIVTRLCTSKESSGDFRATSDGALVNARAGSNNKLKFKLNDRARGHLYIATN